MELLLILMCIAFVAMYFRLSSRVKKLGYHVSELSFLIHDLEVELEEHVELSADTPAAEAAEKTPKV